MGASEKRLREHGFCEEERGYKMIFVRVDNHATAVICFASLFFFFSLSDLRIAFSASNYEPSQMLAPTYKNYFLKDSHRATRQQISNVNKHHLKKALRHLASQKPARAIPELNFTLRYVPNHPKALQLMGLVGKLTNRTKMAEQYFAQAIRVFPQYALTHAQYGKFLVDIGRFEEGIEELEKAQSIQPDLKTVFVWLSEAYQKNGDVDKAKMAEERVKELGSKKKNSSKP